jgi:hypothetical protein
MQAKQSTAEGRHDGIWNSILQPGPSQLANKNKQNKQQTTNNKQNKHKTYEHNQEPQIRIRPCAYQ